MMKKSLLRLFITLAQGGLRLIYFFLKFFKVQEKIVFISRQSDELSVDFAYLKHALEERRPDITLVFCHKKMLKSFSSVLASSTLLLKEMYHLATARVCIIDGYNIPVSILKHKSSLTVIQIWHALIAVKKFGRQCLLTEEEVSFAEKMRMHRNYDWLVSASASTSKYFSEAFNYPLKQFVNIGLPRIDYLQDQAEQLKSRFYHYYPELKGQEIILYVPTFRDNGHYAFRELSEALDLNTACLILKPHPNVTIDLVTGKNMYTCPEFTAVDLLAVADYVISDYSAIILEAAVLDRKVLLYTYDLAEYTAKPGLNIDLQKELTGYVYSDAKQLASALKKDYDYTVLKEFKKKYLTYDHDVTGKLAAFILEKYDEKRRGH